MASRARRTRPTVGVDDLAEIPPESAQPGQLGGSAREHPGRRVHPRGCSRARGLFVALRLPRPRREVVGDFGELLRRIPRVAQTEPAHDRVDHQHEMLGRLHHRRPAGRRRRAPLGRDGLMNVLRLGREEHAAARRHPHPGVDVADRPEEELLVGVRHDPVLGHERLPRGRVVRQRPLEPGRERVDEAIAKRPEGVEPARLRLAHLGRHDRDRRAQPPLGTGERIVVLRLDGDLDGHVALLEEPVPQAQHVAPLAPELSVEPGQHAALLAHPGAKHEVDLAQPVVVGRLVADRDVLGLVGEHDGSRRAVERDDRGAVRDGRDGQRVGLGDRYLAEAGDHPQARGIGEGPARDERARAVVDERHLAGSVRETQAPPRTERRAVQRENRAVGQEQRARIDLVDLVLPHVIRRPRDELDAVEPAHRHRRHVAPRHEDVRAFEDRPCVGQREPERACADRERGPSRPRGDRRGAPGDPFGRERSEGPGHVQPRELRRGHVTRAGVPVGAEERQRPERLVGCLSVERRGKASHDERRLRKATSLADIPGEG